MQNHESWHINSGNSDSHPKVYIFGPGPDGDGVSCQRARPDCNGVMHCVDAAAALVNVSRTTLDPETFNAVLVASTNDRLQQGSTPNSCALV